MTSLIHWINVAVIAIFWVVVISWLLVVGIPAAVGYLFLGIRFLWRGR